MVQPYRPIVIAVASAALLLAACAGGERQGLASASGAAAEEEADLPVASDAVLLGGFASSEIGRDLRPSDHVRMMRSQYRSLEYMPSGRPTRWSNPDSGNYGTFISRAAYADQQGDICRPFTHMVTINGNSRTLSGIACRDVSGRWHEGESG